jgi:hypothetical protein
VNNGIFTSLEAQQIPNTSNTPTFQSALSTPGISAAIYGTNQNKTPSIDYDNLIFVVDTTKEATNVVSIPLGGTVRATIDWGDGTREVFTTAGTRTKTYASRGQYTIQIIGSITSFSFNALANTAKIIRCLSFGKHPLTAISFQGCSNLIEVPLSLPTGVTTLANCFNGCGSFNFPIYTWDTSRITSLAGTFASSSFNRNLNSWNTNKVTNLYFTFNSSSFNEQIGCWDTSNNVILDQIFEGGRFNGSIDSWNVSKVTSMYRTFFAAPFNQPIGNWNTSGVTSLQQTFYNSSFNQSISGWNTSSLTNMNGTFALNGAFNQPIGSWNVSKVTNFSETFRDCGYNQPLSGWDTSSATNMSLMFYGGSAFNQPIPNWNVGKCTDFGLTFGGVTSNRNNSFNQSISGWNIGANVGAATVGLGLMFSFNTVFNQSIQNWDVSKVASFGSMFSAATAFNQPLSGWATTMGTSANVTTINMSNMFNSATLFNQSISGWNVSKVNNFSNMFNTASAFNQPLSGWNIGGNASVTSIDMSYMFMRSPFNQNISNWNTSKVNNMFYMFLDNTVYNQPMNSWDVSKVTSFGSMFQSNATINQDLGNWNVSGINSNGGLDSFMFGVSTMSTSNYNSILIGWESRKSSCRSDLRPSFGSSKYSASSAASVARAALVTYGWTISDGGSVVTAPDPPTSVSGTAGDAQVPLSWTAPTYNNGAAITDYTIQYSSNSGSSWTTFSDGVSTATSGTVTGLTNSTPYIFRVAAVNSAGTGSYSSNSASITPVAPTTTTTTTTTTLSFSPTAVMLTSGSSYTVPAGATSMKAWAVGGGGGTNGPGGGAGGTSFKTWSVSGGSSVAYVVGSAGAIANSPNHSNGGNSTVTYGGTTITGSGGGRGDSGGAGNGTGGGYSGGDGGANGGNGTLTNYPYKIGGAVGGNSQSILICAGYGEAGRRPATDVSGLQAAVTLAGGTATQACGSTAAFGSSSHGGEKNAASQNAGLGGGSTWDFGQGQAGGGAVVLYFT